MFEAVKYLGERSVTTQEMNEDDKYLQQIYLSYLNRSHNKNAHLHKFLIEDCERH